MSNHKLIYYLPTTVLFLLTATLPLFAQDTLPKKEIEVVKSFEPTTTEAVKIKLNPELPDIKTTRPAFDYFVPARPVPASYQPNTIRALAMRPDTEPAGNQFLVRGGYGNFATPLAELYWSSTPSENWQYGARARHTSSRGSLENQQFSDNNLHAFGKHFRKKHTYELSVDYQRDVVHFFGYDDSLYNYEADDVRQRFQTISAAGRFYKNQTEDSTLQYSSGIDFHHFNDLYHARENNFDWQLQGMKTLSSGDEVSLDVSVNPIHYATDSSRFLPNKVDTTRLFITTNPAFTFIKPEWKLQLRIGGKLTFVNDKPFFLPDFAGSRVIIDDHMIYYTGWEGYIEPNTYRHFTNRNPFLTPFTGAQGLQVSQVLDSYTGIRGSFARNFFYKGHFSYKNISDMPFFVNDAVAREHFHIVRDNRVAILNFHVQLGYQQADKFRIVLEADYDSYDMSNLEQPWHEPQFRASLNGHYNMREKLRFHTDIFFLDEIYVPGTDGAEKLNSIIDANFGMQYQYMSNLGFFLNINNFLGRYERWKHYPNFGFQVIGGATFTM